MRFRVFTLRLVEPPEIVVLRRVPINRVLAKLEQTPIRFVQCVHFHFSFAFFNHHSSLFILHSSSTRRGESRILFTIPGGLRSISVIEAYTEADSDKCAILESD